MGKKKGAAIRARKRAKAAAEELAEKAAEQNTAARVEAKSDADLFVVDTVANTSVLSRAEKRKRDSPLDEKEERRLKKQRPSEKEERQVKKLIDRHTAEGVVALVKQTREQQNKKKKSRRIAGNARTNFDLWEEDDTANSCPQLVKPSKTMNKTVLVPVASGNSSMSGVAPINVVQTTKGAHMADLQYPKPSNKQLKARAAAKLTARPTVPVEVAQSGQSYRPDSEQHQDVIGEALSIEIRRDEALEYKKAPLSSRLADETLAIMVGDSDSESSGDDDDESSVEGGGYGVIKRKEKLTRAQRNKQKKVKAEQVALEERRRAKRLLNEVNDVKKHAKAIRKQEVEELEKRERVRKLKEERSSEPLGTNLIRKLAETDPVNVPSLEVALTSELEASNGGTLRTLRPKGNLLTDRVESMVARKLAHRKHTGQRKKIVQGKKRKMKGGKGREFLLI